AFGQTLVASNVSPRVTGVGRLEDAACRSAALEGPRLAIHLPQRGVDDVWISRIECQVGCSRLSAAIEHLLPDLASIGRAKHAALFIGPEYVSLRCDVDDFGVSRVHSNP